MDSRHASFQPWERVFDRIVTPFEEFIREETTSGLVLMVCALAAMLMANSFMRPAYEHVLHAEFAISLAGMELRSSLHHWINDGLMTLFFFVVGLEIKREVVVGELSDAKTVLMPILAAIGGMVMPAALFSALNISGPGADGWGISMATDIAFAVGLLVLLGSRIPKSVFTFLVTLAIVDDLGAVAVIALFYTDQLYPGYLLTAGALLLVLFAFNRFGVRRPLPYFFVGLLIWLAMLESGIHATLAGVLVALTIPVKPRFDPRVFVDHVGELLKELRDIRETYAEKRFCIIHDSRARAILQTLENAVHKVESPLQRLEHGMHMPVALLVVPVFALANAGIVVQLDSLGTTLTHPVTLGVIVGLVLGKPLGIAGVVWLAVKLGWGKLPEGMNGRHLVGVGLISGVGFTMSIFISELGFAGRDEILLMAKTGVLFASIIAGAAGYLWLRVLCRPQSFESAAG